MLEFTAIGGADGGIMKLGKALIGNRPEGRWVLHPPAMPWAWRSRRCRRRPFTAGEAPGKPVVLPVPAILTKR
jgi:hypothetical protein